MSRPVAEVAHTSAVGTDSLATHAPKVTQGVIAALRIVLGFYFLWAFIDKLFGLGFATAAERAWIRGGSPTTGFLKGVEGPFAGFFNSLSGQAWADWLFMIGLLGIGVALIVGAGMRIAAVAAVVLLALMYLASIPLDTNPIFDDHVLEALAIVTVTLIGGGDVFGLGRWWKAQPVVQRNPWLV